jgi:hypothetical protein
MFFESQNFRTMHEVALVSLKLKQFAQTTFWY